MKEHLAAYTVTLHGDLRDWDSAEAIMSYVKERTRLYPMIRQGVVAVDVEGQPERVWQYRDSQWEEVRP